MRARLAAAGLTHPWRHGAPAAGPPGAQVPAGQADSQRVIAARARAGERHDRQRQLLRPLGWAFIAVVAAASLQARPAPGISGARLGVTAILVVFAAALLLVTGNGWARRGVAAQAPAVLLVGACGVALAALQPHGPVELAASMAVWLGAVRLPPVPAAALAAVITAALGTAIALTQHPAAQPVLAATLLCLLLAVTGQFIRRGRQGQDQTELLLAQLEDSRDAQAATAALAERARIAGELHDVLAHALSGLAIQLQGARKLAGSEPASAALRAALDRSAQLAAQGLADARQAVGALRGERLPTLDQIGTLVADFGADTATAASLRIEGTPRPLPGETSLALFRGVQEALTNVARYAPGAATLVTVRYLPGRTAVTVEDRRHPDGGVPGGRDGTRPRGGRGSGAAPATGEPEPVLAGAGGGHGLAAMRERLQRVGGSARAGPSGDGWLVELEVPA
jgi:signal transduction histidine kinase